MRKVKSKMLNVKSYWLTKDQNKISNNEQRILNYEVTPFFFFPKSSLLPTFPPLPGNPAGKA